MKILYLSDDFPPLAKGGASIIAYRIAKDLLKKGHQIFIITSVQKKSQAGEMHFEGMTLFRIYANYHERWRAYLSLYNFQTVNKVEEIIKKIKPDVVHAFNVHYHLSYHCFKIAKQYCKVVFLTACDTMLFTYGKFFSYVNPDNLLIPAHFDYHISLWDTIKQAKKRYNPLRNIIIRWYLKYVDKIFSPSKAIKEALEANHIKNIDVIYSGIDLDEWRIRESDISSFKEKYNVLDKKIVFFGGRLSGLKGGKNIILVMEKVISEIPQAVLLIAGHKDDNAQKMLILAKELKIENNIIFTGWLLGNELKAAYHSCDLAVFPSLYLDGFGLINLEAMAAKKPMVSTCFGGASEIVVDNETGYVVNPFNIKIMAQKISDLLKNPEKAKQFSQIGYERVKKYFSILEQIKKTFKYYCNFLEKKD
ncbi:MAG: glycosyltransferase family 4 protein [Patescibacteria group bacterium]|nr:glycosyltransferase family 4 protein [Patescibacteria group bacterium]